MTQWLLREIFDEAVPQSLLEKLISAYLPMVWKLNANKESQSMLHIVQCHFLTGAD
jgi:hypothetical protein